jgi:hypothetical protein
MSGAPGLRFYLPQVIGAMSTATIASQVSIRNEDLTIYYFVSTVNSVNPNKPYRFSSDVERMKYNMGMAFAIGGANVQNQ